MQHTPYYKCTKLLSDFTNGSGFNKVFRQMSILLDSFKTVGSHLQEFRILFLTGWENSQRTPTPLCKAPALSAPWHFLSTPHQYSKHEIRWGFLFPPIYDQIDGQCLATTQTSSKAAGQSLFTREFVTSEGQSRKSFQLPGIERKGPPGCNAISHASG